MNANTQEQFQDQRKSPLHLVKAPIPNRSLDQRMEALERANEIRTDRAELKRDLKSGRRQIQGLLLDPPEWIDTMKVFDLLLALPKYGRVKVNKILQLCRVSPSKTVGGMSQRQRYEIISMLRIRPIGKQGTKL